jgi:hypothetical protein
VQPYRPLPRGSITEIFHRLKLVEVKWHDATKHRSGNTRYPRLVKVFMDVMSAPELNVGGAPT